jgi:hypothetical protein
VAACDKFIYTENLYTENLAEPEAVPTPAPSPVMAGAHLRGDTSLMNLIRSAVEAASGDDGWAPLAAVGHIVTKQRSDFDPRSYGFPKLGGLVTAIGLFDIDRRDSGDGKQAIIWIRDKRRAGKKTAE